MANIRQIENTIRDSFAVLGTRNDLLDIPLNNVSIIGAQCGIIGKQRVIVLPLDNFSSLTTKRIGGIKVELKTGLQIYGFPNIGPSILIWCLKYNLNEAFNRLIADLLLYLQPSFTIKDIINRLEGWKLLLTGGEDKNQEKGLWGELFFLHFLLQNNKGSIGNWVGPLGGTKDFQFHQSRTEIKTTAVRTGWPVTMHGIYQASIADGIEDYIVFIM